MGGDQGSYRLIWLMVWNRSPLADKRRQPRQTVCLSAVVSNDWGEQVSAEVHNLSLSGIAVVGGGELLAKIFPNFNRAAHVECAHVSVCIHLRAGLKASVQNKIVCYCQPGYVRRLSLDRFQVGLAFASIDADNLARLNEFLLGRNLEV